MNRSSSYADDPRRSRGSFSVLLGFILLICGFVFVATGVVSTAHRALVMKAVPTQISYQQLARDGLGDNAFVSLQNVDFDRNESPSQMESIQAGLSKLAEKANENAGSVDAQSVDLKARIEAIKQQMLDPATRAEFARLVADSFTSIRLYPQGHISNSTQLGVSLARSGKAIELASEQIDHTGEIRGYISLDKSERTRRTIERISDQVNRSDNDAFDSSAWLEIAQEIGNADASETPIYLIDPMDVPPNRTESFAKMAAAGLAIVLGWLLCGSGTASWFMWIFSPIPAIVGMVGFPLRRGRGGRVTRTIYLLIGIFLSAVGAYFMVRSGRFGFTGGSSLEQGLGFMIATTGLAAILATILHRRAQLPLQDFLPPPPVPSQQSNDPILRYQSTNGQTASGPQQEKRETLKYAKMKRADEVQYYTDPRFIAATDDACRSATIDVVERLATIGFSNPTFIRSADDYNSGTIALQFGGEHKVLAEISDNGKRPMVRFISALFDGLAVITVSKNICAASPLQVGENGAYQSINGEPIEDLLTAHLEQTIRLAERRDSQLVTFDHEEKLEICLYARRVFTDLQREFGNGKLEVPSASYERFHFPPQPVQELSATFSID
ncbi:hypothetical protein Q31b_26930 [Novipirellula aureliae]|uniref:Uncharacterized protein n=1 Tax=Novipirellula aureliae TaxID=2527966 RepID=A0A5C6DYF6_9BACT|nr:hypothetical protein [Novipirellula aureliae]TWU41254.1 hypothetical protein Q31b_26930 [Novipirellula aureliae]